MCKLGIAALVLVVAISSMACAEGASVQVIFPTDQDTVYQREIKVTGTTVNIAEGTPVRIYVETNKEYFQGEAKVQTDGMWTYRPVFIGASTDTDFTAILIARTTTIDGREVSDRIKIRRKTICPGTPIELKILIPSSGTVWSRKIPVRGSSTGLEPGTQVEVLVKTNRTYSQGVATVNIDGTWLLRTITIGSLDDREVSAEIFARVAFSESIRSNSVKVFRTGKSLEGGEKYSWGPTELNFTFLGVQCSFDRRDGWTVELGTSVEFGVGLSKTLERNKRLIVYYHERQPPKVYWYRRDKEWELRSPPHSVLICHTPTDDIEIYLVDVE